MMCPVVCLCTTKEGKHSFLPAPASKLALCSISTYGHWLSMESEVTTSICLQIKRFKTSEFLSSHELFPSPCFNNVDFFQNGTVSPVTHSLVLVKKADFKVTDGILGSSPRGKDVCHRRGFSVTESKDESETTNADFAVNSGSMVTCGIGFVVCI